MHFWPGLSRKQLFTNTLIVSLAALSLLLAVLCLYWFSLPFPYHYDDYVNVLGNRAIRYLEHPRVFIETGTQRARLVTNVSYAINYAFALVAVEYYRLTNILLHGLNAVLFFLLTWRLFPRFGSGAFAAALLFALHPLVVESVVYISGRSNLLAVFFALLAVLVAIGRRRQVSMQVRGGSLFALSEWGRFLFFITLSLLAVFSKESGFLVLIWFLLAAWRLRMPRALALLYSLPLFGLAAAAVWFKRGYILAAYNGVFHGLEAALMPKIDWLYTQVGLLPKVIHLYLDSSAQSIHHPVGFIHSPFSWQFVLGAVLLFVVLLLNLVPAMRKRFALAGFALGFAVLSLVPTNFIVPLPDIFAERHLYASVFGFSLFVVVFAQQILQPVLQSVRLPKLHWLPVLAVLIFSATQSHWYASQWQSAEVLWQRTQVNYPGSYKAALQRAHSLVMNSGEYRAARAVLRTFMQKSDATGLRFDRLDKLVQLYVRALRFEFGNDHAAMVDTFKEELPPTKEPRFWRFGIEASLMTAERHLPGLNLLLTEQYQWGSEEQLRANIWLARAHQAVGQFAAAARYFEATLEANVQAEVEREITRMRTSLYRSARMELEQLQQMMQQTIEERETVKANLVESFRGLRKDHDLDESLVHLLSQFATQATELQLGQENILQLKENILAAEKDWEQKKQGLADQIAVAEYDLRLKHRDSNKFWTVRPELAEVYLQLGKTEAAIVQLEAAKRRFKTFKRIEYPVWRRLAESYEAMGRWHEASDNWGDLLKLMLDYPEIRERYARSLQQAGFYKNALSHKQQFQYFRTKGKLHWADKERLRSTLSN